LWVDAICTNQDDVPEKNNQVQPMKDIYEQASKVIAWLGLGDGDTGDLFDFLTGLSEQDLECISTGSLPLHVSEASATVKRFFSFGDKHPQAAFNLAWIAQEVLLACRLEFVCGLKRAPWKIWARYIDMI
ncbi:uncharacterized protein A1O5_08271, partial [Cladophialophora psammophila CBS 110553]